MQRIAFVMRVLPGQEAEYRRRHEAVWPEMLRALKDAGCANYSIYLRGRELFAYMEVEDFDLLRRTLAASEASRRVLESLALKYRWVIDRLDAVTATPVGVVHVVGGGARNRLLCQMTADATGRPVVAGPVEATAAGNLIVQALALGLVRSLDEGRELVRRSFRPERYEPRCQERWEEARERFGHLVSEQGRSA